MCNEQDQHWMAQAINLAKKGLFSTTPNPRVGCVLVTEKPGDWGQCVAEGYHIQAGGPHAEIMALQSAGAAARGATAYVTLEPCNHQGRTGACSEALIKAGVSRVVYGMQDPNPQVAGAGLARIRQAGIEVDGPVLESQCRELNPGFIKRMTVQRPFVRVKVAASLDGRTAMNNGESQWITGTEARADVQYWRARSCAIVTGVSTVLADDPSMTVRIGKNPRQPLRVILDSYLRTPNDAKILLQHGQAVIATTAFKRQGYSAGVSVWGMPGDGGRVNLDTLLQRLAEEGCNEVLVEAGPTLAGAFLARELADEIIIYCAPKLLGSTARPMFELPIDRLSESIELEQLDSRQIGRDWRYCVRPVYASKNKVN